MVLASTKKVEIQCEYEYDYEHLLRSLALELTPLPVFRYLCFQNNPEIYWRQ